MAGKTRNTKQKEVIESSFKGLNGFFTAEELYSMVLTRDKRIGVATVYRILKSMGSEGKIHSYSCGKGRVYSTEGGNHCHFICHRCGKSEHFELKKIDFIKEGEFGKPCHFQLDVHGICRKCMEKV